MILFTKWDRFSRNAADAFQMINLLRKLGVEPCAIEQPLDLDIPENKIMLGIYLTAPEVENDRRSMNVRNGMRRAVKEGRWMNCAPIGYLNRSTPEGKKYIMPREPHAGIIQWAFKEVALHKLLVQHVWKAARKKGLMCCKQQFWNMLRNPVYCGKILLKGYKDEPDIVVKGSHEPLISELLFNEVQDVLDGKKKVYKTTKGSMEELVLRGHLVCPNCGSMLSGSVSKGNGGDYFYYHCKSSCRFRHRSDRVNSLFEKELSKWVPKPGMAEVYFEVVNSVYQNRAVVQNKEVAKLNDRLDKIQADMQGARRKFMTDQVDRTEYNEFKNECEAEFHQF